MKDFLAQGVFKKIVIVAGLLLILIFLSGGGEFTKNSLKLLSQGEVGAFAEALVSKINFKSCSSVSSFSKTSAGLKNLSEQYKQGKICKSDLEKTFLISSSRTASTSFVCGDVDGSGVVDLSDAVYLINYIFNNGPAPDPLTRGDVDASDIVDLSDAVYLINYIFSGGPAPVCAKLSAEVNSPAQVQLNDGGSFNFESVVTCSGGDCGNVVATLKRDESNYSCGNLCSTKYGQPGCTKYTLGPTCYISHQCDGLSVIDDIKINKTKYVHPGEQIKVDVNYDCKQVGGAGANDALVLWYYNTVSWRQLGKWTQASGALTGCDSQAGDTDGAITQTFNLDNIEGQHVLRAFIMSDEGKWLHDYPACSVPPTTNLFGDFDDLEMMVSNSFPEPEVGQNNDYPFYVNEQNPKVCSNLTDGGSCITSWNISENNPGGNFKLNVSYLPEGASVKGTETSDVNVHSAADGKTYYVATTGSDANDGSLVRPWKTIQHAIDQIPKEGGATILVRDGIYNGRVNVIRTFDNWVTLKSEHPYKAKLVNNDGQLIGDTILYIQNSSGTINSTKLNVEGFIISNKNSGNPTCTFRWLGFVVHIQDTSDVNLRNNIIYGSDFPSGACNEVIKVNRWGPYFPRNIKIAGNIISDHPNLPGVDLIDSVKPGELDIIDNIFFTRNSGGAQSFITIKREANEVGVVPPDVKSPRYTIARNVFLNYQGKSDEAFIQLGEDGAPQHEATDALIENNLLIGNSTDSMAAPMQLLGVLGANVRANTIIGDLPAGSYGFRIGTTGENPTSGNYTINNNIWADPAGSMGVRFSMIFGKITTSTISLNRNLYWNNGSSLPIYDWLNPAIDSSKIVANPLINTNQANVILPVFDEGSGMFISGSATIRQEFERLVNFYGAIPQNSPARDAALISNMPIVDILGNLRDALPDIGSFEYLGSGKSGSGAPRSY